MTSRDPTDDIRRRLDEAPMDRTRIAAIAVTVAISAIDGFDVLAVSFAAPAIIRDWGLGKAALGLVFSSGLVGMAIGSFFLAPLADRIGRRPMAFVSLVLMAAGMLLCASAPNMPLLATFRVLTGLGVGTMVAIINPLAAEFSNRKRRPLAMALMAMGYPAGGIFGGLLSAFLLSTIGWQAIFLAGFLATALLAPLAFYFLPESFAYLSTRGAAALGRMNALLQRCGLSPVAHLPQPRRGSRSYRRIFAADARQRTMRVTLVNLGYTMVMFYVLSWLPQMVADAGYRPQTASLVATVNSFAGIVGGVLLGLVAQRLQVRALTAAMMAAVGFTLAAFGMVGPSLPLLILTAGVCGYFMYAGSAGLFTLIAAAFTDEARATGTGFVIGVGRIGSAVAPAMAGWMFGIGLGRAEVSVAFATLAIGSGLGLALSRDARAPVAELQSSRVVR